jgi:hypothetical protein
MNQNLLGSCSSSARSDLSSRPPSPISDDDYDQDYNQGLESDTDDHDFILPQSLSVGSFFSPDPTCPSFMVLPTNFNINATKNKKVPYPRGKDRKAEKLRYTEEQRMHAIEAIVPKDSDDFANVVRL